MEEEKKTEDVKEEKKEENPKNNNETELNMGFFKKVWYSITKIEKYPNMAAQGLGKAISYLAKIVAILAVVFCLGVVYQTHNMIGEGIEYLQNSFPEFSYKDGTLNVESEEPITISAEDSIAGETIIDTKTEDENVINQYINQVTNAGGGIIILKDKVTVKNANVAGTISYSYKDTFGPMGITEFDKQGVIDFANSSKIVSLYVSVFLTMFIYAFVAYFLNTLTNAILLSFFGFFTAWLARIKMRYVAIFNMSVYALTLSVILNMLYIGVNIFIPFEMEYFQVMYVAVAAIYLVAAILILKSEFVKKQMELMKIAEAQEEIKKQMEEKEREEAQRRAREEQRKKEKEREEKEKKEKEKEEKEEKKGNQGEEPQGSGA